MANRKYVLITPARNEEANIRRVLESVVVQTHPPEEWVIVSDGSTDRTAEIAREFQIFPFIKVISRPSGHQEDFGSKVTAFNLGLSTVRAKDYAYLGNLDADVSLPVEYFERLIARMECNRRLGLAGGNIIPVVDGQRIRRKSSLNSVPGAVHFYRRKCFEQIGGYMPLKEGGEDSVSEIKARMLGWNVRMYPDLEVIHHGPVHGRAGNIFRARFRKGAINYLLGYHPLFQLSSSLWRLGEKPRLSGAFLMTCGYFWKALQHHPREVSSDFVEFLRQEQMQRLKGQWSAFSDKLYLSHGRHPSPPVSPGGR